MPNVNCNHHNRDYADDNNKDDEVKFDNGSGCTKFIILLSNRYAPKIVT